MSAPEVVLPDPSAWQAQVLRLTAFAFQPDSSGPQEWWQTLRGEGPETVVAQPKRDLHQEEGPFQNGTLALKIERRRIDWVLAPRLDPTESTDDIPTLGPFPEALEPFHALTQRWFPLGPAVERLAFGAVLLQPVGDHRSGYRLLGSYLHAVQMDPESSEFQYRINRRRHSASVADLQINRLCTWSCVRWEGVRMALELGSLTAERRPLGRGYACRLELDINTDPEFPGELPRGQLPKLFAELIDRGREIAARGDIK